MLFLSSIFLLLCWNSFFTVLTKYYIDSWIITNERTIYTELRGFFNSFSSSIPHEKVQDITIDVNGFLPTVFHYGDLHIQTAGAFKEFIFRQIPDPEETKDILLETIKNAKNKI